MLQLHSEVRDARLDAIRNAVGPSAVLEIRSGSKPKDCNSADAGKLLSSMNLPAEWMSAASGGVMSIGDVWRDESAIASGKAGHFRIRNARGCRMQGDVTRVGGGGALQLRNLDIVQGQQVTVTAFDLIDGDG